MIQKYRVYNEQGGYTEYANLADVPPNSEYEIVEEPIVTQEEIIQNNIFEETQKYKQRILDGQETYAQISAKFRVLKLYGVISEESQRDIENLFKPVRNEVLAGQWVDARIQLESLHSIAISMGKEDLYNEIYNIINNYIQSSYTTYEIQMIQRNAR